MMFFFCCFVFCSFALNTEGKRLEDAPRAYVDLLLNRQVWKGRPDLWRAFSAAGLVLEKPPPVTGNDGSDELKGVDFTFDFGMHDGKRWDDVPKSYRDWIFCEEVWKNKARGNLLDALLKAGFHPPEEDEEIEETWP